MRKGWILGIAAAIVLVVGFLAYTLNTGTTDPGEIEDNISTEIERQTGDSVTVDCPDEIEWQAGQTFRCLAEPNRGPGSLVTVYMETDDGDYTWETR